MFNGQKNAVMFVRVKKELTKPEIRKELSEALDILSLNRNTDVYVRYSDKLITAFRGKVPT